MRWSVVVPFYNEQAYLADTVNSLLAQSRACRLILVNNGSTDDSRRIAQDLIAPYNGLHLLVDEECAGQVYSLERGLALVETEYVAICDADTFYPSAYLARAEALLQREDIVVASAWPLRPGASAFRRVLSALHRVGAIRLLSWQNHVAGSGHAFCTAALERAGGYCSGRWPFVLKDHELMARVMLEGKQAADWDHWCSPSPRREDRKGVRWTLAERLRYHATPRSGQVRFFEQWLAPRLEKRDMRDTVLREQPWNNVPV